MDHLLNTNRDTPRLRPFSPVQSSSKRWGRQQDLIIPFARRLVKLPSGKRIMVEGQKFTSVQDEVRVVGAGGRPSVSQYGNSVAFYPGDDVCLVADADSSAQPLSVDSLNEDKTLYILRDASGQLFDGGKGYKAEELKLYVPA